MLVVFIAAWGDVCILIVLLFWFVAVFVWLVFDLLLVCMGFVYCLGWFVVDGVVVFAVVFARLGGEFCWAWVVVI